MPRLRPRLPVLLAVLAGGCGGVDTGVGTVGYADEAQAACRAFNDAAFAEQVEFSRARELYAGLAEDLAGLTPPEDLRSAHGVMLGFARGGERLFAGARDPDAPKTDLRLVVGDWEDDVPRVERDLPACADSLTGTHPEIQVIR